MNINKLLAWLAIIILGICTYLVPVSANQNWHSEYVINLQGNKPVVIITNGKNKIVYTPTEEQTFMVAVTRAIKQGADACECMKIAIDMNYTPYLVLKTIYSIGSYIKLDQLCMCATETGIMKAIIVKAAIDATLPTGEHRFSRDEIIQSQCLKLEKEIDYIFVVPALPTLPPIKIDIDSDKSFATKTTF